MKRCPECRKDYLDDSLLYCLDDGRMLVQGSVTDEPATAILSEPRAVATGFRDDHVVNAGGADFEFSPPKALFKTKTLALFGASGS